LAESGLSGAGWILLQLLRVVPKNALSRFFGRVVCIRWPLVLARPLVSAFARAVGADVSEAKQPISSFDSIQSFFVRALRDGVRAVDPDPRAFVSPCDGAWGTSGRIESGTLLQVKGSPYSLGDLLASRERAKAFEGGQYATLYLSPRDYHRFHAPCDAEVERVDYVPGRLWPVNRIGLEGVPGLFAQNERLCIHLSPRPANTPPAPLAGSVCLVAVGATMVGKTKLTFSNLETNVRGARRAACVFASGEARLARGEEMGRFEFGSTIVVLVSPGAVVLDAEEAGSVVRMGERIGGFVSGPG
jgi:phosphatidylserine decarboxylase